MGALIGPTIAYFVRDSFGNEFVYLVSAAELPGDAPGESTSCTRK